MGNPVQMIGGAGASSALGEYGPLGLAVLVLTMVIVQLVNLFKTLQIGRANGTSTNGTVRLGESDREWMRGLVKKHLTTQLELPEKTLDQIDDLYRWHNNMDADGVPRWVIGTQMRNDFKDMADGIGKLVTLAKTTNENQERRDRLFERLLNRAISGQHEAVDITLEDGDEDDGA